MAFMCTTHLIFVKNITNEVSFYLSVPILYRFNQNPTYITIHSHKQKTRNFSLISL